MTKRDWNEGKPGMAFCPGGGTLRGSHHPASASMKLLRTTPIVVAFLAVATITWVLVRRASRQSEWLRAEVSAQVAAGGRFAVNLTLTDPRPGQLLRVDLHWKDGQRQSRGMLSTVGAQPIRAGVRDYRFDLPVPAREGAAYLYGVVFVSPTGRWSDRTHTALLEPIAVSPILDAEKAGRMRRIAAHDQSPGPPPKRQDSRVVRWANALFLTLAAILCWQARRREGGESGGAAGLVAVRWTGLALACALAAGWEASAVDAALGDALRQLAMARGWYDGRRHLQEVLTGIVIAASVVGAVVALRRDHAQPASLVFSGVDAYWGIAAVSFISLHDADAWLATPVAGVPVVQVGKGAAAFAAACGALLAVRISRRAARAP